MFGFLPSPSSYAKKLIKGNYYLIETTAFCGGPQYVFSKTPFNPGQYVMTTCLKQNKHGSKVNTYLIIKVKECSLFELNLLNKFNFETAEMMARIDTKEYDYRILFYKLDPLGSTQRKDSICYYESKELFDHEKYNYSFGYELEFDKPYFNNDLKISKDNEAYQINFEDVFSEKNYIDTSTMKKLLVSKELKPVIHYKTEPKRIHKHPECILVEAAVEGEEKYTKYISDNGVAYKGVHGVVNNPPTWKRVKIYSCRTVKADTLFTEEEYKSLPHLLVDEDEQINILKDNDIDSFFPPHKERKEKSILDDQNDDGF